MNPANVSYYSSWYVSRRLREFEPGVATEVASLDVESKYADDHLRNFDAVARQVLTDVQLEMGLVVVEGYRVKAEAGESLQIKWLARTRTERRYFGTDKRH